MNSLLHNHPRMESELGLDKDHVIVDKKYWELVLQFLCETRYISKLDKISRSPETYNINRIEKPLKQKINDSRTVN